MLPSSITVREAFYSNAPRTFPSSIVNFTHLKKGGIAKSTSYITLLKEQRVSLSHFFESYVFRRYFTSTRI